MKRAKSRRERGAVQGVRDAGQVLTSWQRWYGRRKEFVEADAVSVACMRVARASPSSVQFTTIMPRASGLFFVVGDEVFYRRDGDEPGQARRVGVVTDAITFPSCDGERVAGQVLVSIGESERRDADPFLPPGVLLNRSATTGPVVDAWIELLSPRAAGGDRPGPTLEDVLGLLRAEHPRPTPRLARSGAADIMDECVRLAKEHRARGERVAIVAIDEASAAILAGRLWKEHGLVGRWRGANPSAVLLPIVDAALQRVKDLVLHGHEPGGDAIKLLERTRSLDPAALREAWLALVPDVEILTVADALAMPSPPGDGITIVPCEAGMTAADVLAATRASFGTLVLVGSTPPMLSPSDAIPEDAWLPCHLRRRERYPVLVQAPGEPAAVQPPAPSACLETRSGGSIWEGVDCEWPFLERSIVISFREQKRADLAKAIAISHLLQSGPASSIDAIASTSFLSLPAARDIEEVVGTCLLTGLPLGARMPLETRSSSEGMATDPPPVVPPADLHHVGMRGGSPSPARVVVTGERRVKAAATVHWRVSGGDLVPVVAWKDGSRLGRTIDDAVWCMGQAGQLPTGLLPGAAPGRHHPIRGYARSTTGGQAGDPAIVPPAALPARAIELVRGTGGGAIVAFLPPEAGLLATALDAAMKDAKARASGEEEKALPLLLRVSGGSEAGIGVSPGEAAITLPRGSLLPDVPAIVASKARVLSAVSVSGLMPGRALQGWADMPAASSDGLERVVASLLAHLPALVQKLLEPGREDMKVLASLVEWVERVAGAIASLSDAGAKAPQLALDAARKFLAAKQVDALVGKPGGAAVRAALVSWAGKVAVLFPPLARKRNSKR